MEASHTWELPYGDLAVLDAIVRYLRPRTVLELGTFTGPTTKLIADAPPAEAIIHTIDVPPEAIGPEWETVCGVTPDMMGRAFASDPRYERRIVFHRSFTPFFDYTPLRRSVDLAFVDASHDYADVVRDSAQALDLLAPGGVVVWDDSPGRTLASSAR